MGMGRPEASVSMKRTRGGATGSGGGEAEAHLTRRYEYSRETVGGSRQ